MRDTKRVRMLAQRLRDARRDTGLSQMESAARLGRSQSYISRCEAGLRRMDVFELAEFARVYEKGLAFFVENLAGRGENGE